MPERQTSPGSSPCSTAGATAKSLGMPGKKAPQELLISVGDLVDAYYKLTPDPENPAQRVAFGTSGHRGNAFSASFNEAHVLAVTQAVCEHRKAQGISGPLHIGMDTHALSAPAHRTALEVLAANEVSVIMHARKDSLDEVIPTPTPVISFNILAYNRTRPNFAGIIDPENAAPGWSNSGLSDGIVITPSHNPPSDGGFKYNPPHGGPADTDATGRIEKRANELLSGGNKDVRRLPLERALKSGHIRPADFIGPYAEALSLVLNMQAIAASGLKIGVDPLGGSSLPFWEPIAKKYGLNLTVTNPILDPAFSFMPLDHDGKIRMDCSSPYAMAGLIEHAASYELAFGNDPDADRHGIVTPRGLMNPNHYLAVAVWYLFQRRPGWPKGAKVGKTLVTSALLDRVAHSIGREVYEVPVGFKWFVPGLLRGFCGFGGEESAGASFLRLDGSAWTTDKDGLLLGLLAAEITAVTGKAPDRIYEELADKLGRPYYERKDAPATAAQKKVLSEMSPDELKSSTLAGDPITGVFTRAPGNNAGIGGLKVESKNGWFAARPSGTEDIYKIYAESFAGQEHLTRLQAEAVQLVDEVFAHKLK